MDKERFLQSGLLEQYVLGLTTEEENEEVERYADAFPEIRSEIALLKNAVKQYAEEQIAGPKVKKINNSDPAAYLSDYQDDTADNTSSTNAGRWIMAALLLLSFGLGIHFYAQYRQSEKENTQLNNSLVSFKSDCEKDREIIEDLQKQLAFYEHHRTQPLQLEGTSLAPDSKVRVFWNEQEKHALLQVISLPSPPAQEQYQIWADKDGKMVNLGLIHTNSDQPQMIRCLPQASSLNITLEPAGGSTVPQVDKLYANVSL